MSLEPTASQREEIDKLLDQVREQLTALWLTEDAGFVTCHVGPDGGTVESNQKLPKVKRKQKPITPARQSWG